MTSIILQWLPLPTTYYPLFDSDPMFAGVSMPDMLLILMLVGFVFAVPSVPALVSKWLLFISVLRRFRRPSFFRLCGVALIEMLCAVAAVKIAIWSIAATVICLPLAMSSNLLLFQQVDQSRGAEDFQFSKKSLCAFITGLIYPLYIFAFALALWYFCPYFFFCT